MNRAINSGGARKPRAARKPVRRKSVAQLNAWLSANYDELLEKARRDCMALTGKPTFGSAKRRKSA
jgi:hypothetical protein